MMYLTTTNKMENIFNMSQAKGDQTQHRISIAHKSQAKAKATKLQLLRAEVFKTY